MNEEKDLLIKSLKENIQQMEAHIRKLEEDNGNF